MSVAVCGVPRSGKTTANPTAMHADDWLTTSHHYAVNKAASELRKGSMVEGCAVVFALCKAVDALTEVRWHDRERIALTPPQARFAARCRQAWSAALPTLRQRGVRITVVR